MSEREKVAERRILTVNTGSSSLKAALFVSDSAGMARQASFFVERIGSDEGRSSLTLPGQPPQLHPGQFPGHDSALGWVLEQCDERLIRSSLDAVGHRLVHGGTRYSAPAFISPAMLSSLRRWLPVDPDHLPQALAAIEAVATRFPALAQIACFDTHFHETMPAEAMLLPLPQWLRDEGVRRFGFHGLSYESILNQLERIDPAAVRGRVVVAHLGSGASMAAVRNGRSIDTTMGFTPTGGIMMGTRPGDLDPGLLLYLLQVRAMSADDINRLLNKESGLLGVSGTSQDTRDLLAVEESDSRAADALHLFCHIAKKHLAALAATLGGLDTVIFTAGVGEHSPAIRERICDGLQFIGMSIDPERNNANDAVISRQGSAVTVRVMHTDEERVVAAHTFRLITN